MLFTMKAGKRKENSHAKNQIYLIAVIEAILFIAFAFQMVTNPSWTNLAILVVLGIGFVQLKDMYDKAKQKEDKNL